MHRLRRRFVRRGIYSEIDRIEFPVKEEVRGRLPVTVHHRGLVGSPDIMLPLRVMARVVRYR